MAGMYSERLVVRNFGPITNLDIEFRRLTLFIGDQGSGKSTLSKLLTICRDFNWWLLMLENADAEDVRKPFFDFGINEYFMDDTFINYTMTGFSIKYENGAFSIVSNYIGAKEIRNYFQYINKRYGNGEDSSADKAQLKELEPYARAVLYILAERNLVGNLSESLASMLTAQVPLPKPLMEYMSMFERAKKEYPSYNIPFFNVKFVQKNGKERIELVGKDKDLPLSACSSGLQSAIPMLMVIDYALKTDSFDSFVIEEPEQNLFPQNQFKMLAFVTSRLWHPRQRRQFIITTHSPYMLSSLNVLMLAYKLQKNEATCEEAEKIISPDYMVNPDDVAVYSLDPDSEKYCKSLISEKTGLVSVNELDSVSEVIGDKYDRLYRLYVKTLKK